MPLNKNQVFLFLSNVQEWPKRGIETFFRLQFLVWMVFGLEPVLLVLVAFVLAFGLGELFKFLGATRLVGQVLAGIILSLPVFGFLFSQDATVIFGFLSEVGEILLFFWVGLEMNLRYTAQNFKAGVLISVFNTLVPFGASLLVLPLLGISSSMSVVVGLALAASSVPIAVEFLSENRLLSSRIGSLVMVSGAMEHLFELFLITLVLSFVSHSLSVPALFSAGLGFLALVLLLVLFRFSVIPWLLRFFESEKSDEGFFAGAVILALLMAFISIALGFGALLGALVGGIVVRHTLSKGADKNVVFEHRMAKHIHLIAAGFFVPLFFVWVGYQIDLPHIVADPLLSGVLILLAFVSAIGGTLIGIFLARKTLLEGLVVAMAMSTKGGIELAVATLALGAGVISRDVFSALIVMALVTTVISTIFFKYLVLRYCVGKELGAVSSHTV